ncbi:hypothetical protein HPB47_020638 [Ixodes persulcatus]|uniref:Uncharacterized protein n=1 Tax=Ixodes persulcatus TaxID=34615 RepID=A0AC60QFT9_IXOPE|nr:hypothetical protein HPB47_020638 [Ixodes persulcatus]
MCKLIRSETWKQVERYRDCLRVLCFARATDQQAAERSFGSHLRSAGQMTEFLWRQQLPWLPKKRPTSKNQRGVTFLGGASLPNELRATLDRGPKFAFEPQLTAIRRSFPWSEVWPNELCPRTGKGASRMESMRSAAPLANAQKA